MSFVSKSLSNASQGYTELIGDLEFNIPIMAALISERSVRVICKKCALEFYLVSRA